MAKDQGSAASTRTAPSWQRRLGWPPHRRNVGQTLDRAARSGLGQSHPAEGSARWVGPKEWRVWPSPVGASMTPPRGRDRQRDGRSSQNGPPRRAPLPELGATRSRAASPCLNCSALGAGRTQSHDRQDQDASPLLDKIEELASRMRVRWKRCRSCGSIPLPAPNRPKASLPRPARSNRGIGRSLRATRKGVQPFLLVAAGSPTRATSVRCCAAQSALASPVWCCRVTDRPAFRRP